MNEPAVGVPLTVPNYQIVVQFHDGPKIGEFAQFSVPADKGAPHRIQIVNVDPQTGVVRYGSYRQSGFHAYLYVWSGWDSGPLTPQEQ